MAQNKHYITPFAYEVGTVLSYLPNGRFPVVSGTIFKTKADADEYLADNGPGANAHPGAIIAVIGETNQNGVDNTYKNGIYLVQGEIDENQSFNNRSLVKIGDIHNSSLGKNITNKKEEVVFDASANTHTVLQSIYTELENAVAGGVTEIQAGSGITTTTGTKPTVSIMLDTTEGNGNLLEFNDSDKSLRACLYYEVVDEDFLPKTEPAEPTEPAE
jgi:hypothetical protein